MVQRRCFNIRDTILCFFFFLYPIIPDYTRVIGRPLYVYLSLITSILLFCFALNNNKLLIKKDSTTFFVLLYTVFITIPIFATAGFFTSVIIFFKYCMPIIITIHAIKNNFDFEKIISIVIIAAFPVVIISFLELTGFNLFSFIENVDLSTMGTSAQMRMGIYRLEGPFGHAISYGIYLTFISALTQYKLIITENKRFKYMLIIMFCLTCLAEFLTLSRAPIIIYIFTQIFIFFLFNVKHKLRVIANIIVFSVISIVILEIIGLDIFGAIETIFGFFETLTSNSMSNKIDFGTNANPYEYRFALFNRVFDMMKNSKISFLVGDYLWENNFSVDNGYLSLIIFNGILGLIGRILLYVYALFISIIGFFKNYYLNSKDKVFYYISIIILMGYLLNLTSVAQMNETPTLLIIIGLILGKNRIDKYQW